MAEHGLLHGNIPGLGICKFHFRIKQLLLASFRIGWLFNKKPVQTSHPTDPSRISTNVRTYSGEEPPCAVFTDIYFQVLQLKMLGKKLLNSISSTEMTRKLHKFRPDRVDRTCQCAPPCFKQQRERLKQKRTWRYEHTVDQEKHVAPIEIWWIDVICMYIYTFQNGIRNTSHSHPIH